MTAWRIVCDAGGTSLRFGRFDAAAGLSRIEVLPTDRCASFEDAILGYAHKFEDHAELAGVAVAGAGPVEGECVQLTNASLRIRAKAVSAIIGGKPVRLLNDLEAVGWSVPSLSAAQLDPVLTTDNPLAGPRIVVNVGTGFGASILIGIPSGWHVLACEPGHMKLASGLSTRDGPLLVRTAVEDVISGQALREADIWAALRRACVDEARADLKDDVFAAAAATSEGRDLIADFSALYGQICGDLVLASGAWGGVYTCGSVAAAWSRHADKAPFKSAFLAKGAMAARMERVPVSQILAPYPALLGLCEVTLA